MEKKAKEKEKMPKGKYESSAAKTAHSYSIVIVLACLLLFMLSMVLMKGCYSIDNDDGKDGATIQTTPQSQLQEGTGTATSPTEATTAPTAPTEPYVVTTASVGTMGDLLMHLPVIQAAQTGSTYDFSPHFAYISEYFQKYDYMVINLETTLGSLEAGPYHGYPNFNCPDEIIDGVKEAGVDLILTANNHTYDTGNKGFMRTQQVIKDRGLSYLGTRENAEDPEYIVQDINGIKVGMVCYTYETGKTSDGRKTLNGIPMTAADSARISSFDYKDLNGFYTNVTNTLAAMEQEGAEATMVFIHWGDEYQLKPNSYQTAIAQKLCDLGVDVIVGGHPHVVQPFDTLVSESGHQTYCIYSVGNAVSNQNRNSLKNTTSNAKYTEDGMIFGVEFEKWNDGSVNVSAINILPTWVKTVYASEYDILPLDTSIPVWNNLGVSNEALTYESYNRTLSVVGAAYNACLEELGLPTAPTTFAPEE